MSSDMKEKNMAYFTKIGEKQVSWEYVCFLNNKAFWWIPYTKLKSKMKKYIQIHARQQRYANFHT